MIPLAAREPREAGEMRSARVGLAVVLLVAAALRFWDIGHGIPHAIGAAEPEIVGRAFGMMQAGSLNPHFYDYGQLQITLQLGVSVIRFLAGASAGEWYSLDGATSHSFYLWGRLLSAALGTATVLLVFSIARRWSVRHALLASALMAVVPAHVEFSQLVVPDVLLTFCVALVLLLSLMAQASGRLSAFAMAGAAAGLAAGSRYAGALAIVMPLIACGWTKTDRGNYIAATMAVLGGGVVGFVVAAPYNLIDFPSFLDRFAQLAAEARQVPKESPGWPALLLMAAALIIGGIRVMRGPERGPWAIVVGFMLVYVAVLTGSGATEDRQWLPLTPMLCILAAAVVISAVCGLQHDRVPRAWREPLVAVLTVAVLVPGAAASVAYSAARSKQTTVDLAYAWVRQNLPAETVVVVEAGALSLPRGIVEGRGITELRLKTADEFAREGVQYLIATSHAYGRYLAAPRLYRDEYLAYTRLFSEAREVARFTPGKAHPGPELRVLQVVP